MTFRKLLEGSTYQVTPKLHTFIDHLYDYMDLYDKSEINTIIKLGTELNVIEKKAKVFRVTCNSDLGDFDLVSCSTSKLKGKTLDGVTKDMKDRYTRYKKIECVPTYLELQNVEGIDITKLGKFVIDNKAEFDSEAVDMFKRLKSEKEFLAIKKSITIKNKEEI